MNEVFLSLRLIRGSCRECVLTACKFGESRVGEAYDSPPWSPSRKHHSSQSCGFPDIAAFGAGKNDHEMFTEGEEWDLEGSSLCNSSVGVILESQNKSK